MRKIGEVTLYIAEGRPFYLQQESYSFVCRIMEKLLGWIQGWKVVTWAKKQKLNLFLLL